MKYILKLAILSMIALTFSACGDDDKGDDVGKLEIKMNLTYENAPLVMFEKYDYMTGEEFYITKVSYYLADISLDNVLLKEAEYFNLTNSHSDLASATNGFSYILDSIPTGVYSELSFGMGVTPANNAKVPGDFTSDHALARSGEYWDAWSSFVFYKIEGMIDVNGDGEFEGISLHVGGDEVYSTVTFNSNFPIVNGATTQTLLNIDLANVFGKDADHIYDLVGSPRLHSKSLHLTQMEELMANTVATVTLK